MPLDRIDGEILFDIDYNSLEQALQGTGWLSGWGVTGNASTLSVDVAAGIGLVSGVLKSTTSSTNIALSPADPDNPRKDLIIWDTSLPGLTKVTGVAQAISPTGETNPRKMKLPAPPDLTATDDILIAVVYVPAGATKGSDCTIIDKRVKVAGFNFRTGWTADKILLGAGVNAAPTEIDGLRSKIITTTRALNAPSETISYTGVGFKPTAIIAFAARGATSGGYNSWGFADSSGAQFAIQIPTSSNTIPANVLVQCDYSETQYQRGTLVSFDNDGFTISWVVAGSPSSYTIYIRFLCLR